jgi:hypothetical protein
MDGDGLGLDQGLDVRGHLATGRAAQGRQQLALQA